MKKASVQKMDTRPARIKHHVSSYDKVMRVLIMKISMKKPVIFLVDGAARHYSRPIFNNWGLSLLGLDAAFSWIVPVKKSGVELGHVLLCLSGVFNASFIGNTTRCFFDEKRVNWLF